ncbi:MAG: sugar phosphate isomerase/epimerase family protein [Sphingomonadaceae bacterium]
MHPAISINTLSLTPDALGRQIDFVARLGASAISIDLMQIDEFGIERTVSTLGDAGLCLAILTHRAFGFATPEEARSARERLDCTIEIAAELNAGAVLMTTGGRGALGWEEAADRFADAIAPCRERAQTANVVLGIEPTSHLYADASIAHRLADTTEVALRAGIAVIPDLFACWSDADLDAAIAEAGPLIAAVQVADYVYGDRALPCRAVPGDGVVPFARIVPALASTGFAGPYDLEIIGPRLQAEGEEQGLRRAARLIEQLLNEGNPE